MTNRPKKIKKSKKKKIWREKYRVFTHILINAEIFNPGSFFFQLAEDAKGLHKFLDELNAFYDGSEMLENFKVSSGHLLLVGDWVAAVWSEDNFWYRARVRGIVSLSHVELQFVDYGTRTVCSRNKLYR